MGVANPDGVVEMPYRFPKCRHIFGDKCIKKWTTEAITCPYCRTPLVDDTAKVNRAVNARFLLARGQQPESQDFVRYAHEERMARRNDPLFRQYGDPGLEDALRLRARQASLDPRLGSMTGRIRIRPRSPTDDIARLREYEASMPSTEAIQRSMQQAGSLAWQRLSSRMNAAERSMTADAEQQFAEAQLRPVETRAQRTASAALASGGGQAVAETRHRAAAPLSNILNINQGTTTGAVTAGSSRVGGEILTREARPHR